MNWLLAALLLAPLLLVPGMREGFEGPKAWLVRACGLGALAALALAPAAWRRLRPQPLDLAVGAWLVVELATTLASRAPLLSLFGEYTQREGLLTSLAMAGLYLTARLSLAVPAARARAIDATLIAASIASGYALLQAAKLDPVDWAPALVAGAGGAVGRPFGTLGHPNLLGVVAAAAAVMAWVRAALLGPGRQLHLAAGALCTGAVVVTLSRAAWLGLAAGLVVVVVLLLLAGRATRPSGRTLLAGAGLLVALVALVALSGWGGRMAARFDELLHPMHASGSARLETWRTALDMGLARPITGWGPDTFAMMFTRFQTPGLWTYEWGASSFHAHSIVFHAFATRGAFGLLAALAWIVALTWTLARLWLARPAERGWLATAAGALTALVVAGLFGALGVNGHLLVAVLSGAAAAMAADEAWAMPGAARSDGSVPDPPRLAHRTGLAVAAVVAVAACLDVAASRGAVEAQAWLAASREPDPRAAAGARGQALSVARRAASLAPADDALRVLAADALLATVGDVPAPAALIEEAVGDCRAAVAIAPERAVNHLQLGRALVMRVRGGDRAAAAEAADALERAAALAPAHAGLQDACARLELSIGRPQRARELAQRITAIYPQASSSWLVLAEAQATVGDRPAAIVSLERALAGEWRGDEAGRAVAARALRELGAR